MLYLKAGNDPHRIVFLGERTTPVIYPPPPPQNERKAGGRKALIALAIVCLILLASTVFALSNLSAKDSQIDSLNNDINALQNQLNAASSNASSTGLSVGTWLETYYAYVRVNYYTYGLSSDAEESWSTLPNYYNVSVTFASQLAAHDIGNLFWPTLENGSRYYDTTEPHEYSFQTADHIIEKAMNMTGISISDSNVMKIEKVLAFIHSTVHYELRLIDHFWFPCETLTFKSGDCTSFSILAASMFEKAGIESAIGFFANSSLGGHAMVLVHMDDLGPYNYTYYGDLTGYGLTSGKWILIEPQASSLEQYGTLLNTWIKSWDTGMVASAEVPFGP